jgi:hypothetical protein
MCFDQDACLSRDLAGMVGGTITHGLADVVPAEVDAGVKLAAANRVRGVAAVALPVHD